MTRDEMIETYTSAASSLLRELGLHGRPTSIELVAVGFTNANEAGRQEGLEEAADVCRDQACYFRNWANREKNHNTSDHLLGIAKGFSKACSAIRALQDAKDKP